MNPTIAYRLVYIGYTYALKYLDYSIETKVSVPIQLKVYL